jgi:hypothetical protein
MDDLPTFPTLADIAGDYETPADYPRRTDARYGRLAAPLPRLVAPGHDAAAFRVQQEMADVEADLVADAHEDDYADDFDRYGVSWADFL